MKRVLTIALVLLAASTARAHKPSDSYLNVRSEDAQLAVQWDIALRDLDFAVGLDGNGDGAITWGELRGQERAVIAYALARLQLDGDGAACAPGRVEQLVDRHSDGAYAVLRFTAVCPHAPRTLAVRYRLFFDFDPQHRGVLQIAGTPPSPPVLLTAEQPLQYVDLAADAGWQGLRAAWLSGLRHLGTDADHVLFLLALLLPAVLRRRNGRWQAAGAGEALRGTVKVVAAFTIAHSLTLAMAAVGLVQMPARVLEPAVAASVVLVALLNAVPFFADARWLIGFAGGLLHGVSFASALAGPELPPHDAMLAVLGFNAGVESGQLLVLMVFLPLAFMARRSWLYQRVTVLAGSCAIAGVAGLWLIERALAVHLIG